MLAANPFRGAAPRCPATRPSASSSVAKRGFQTTRALQPGHSDWDFQAAKPDKVITFVTSEGLVNLSDSRGLFQGLVQRQPLRLRTSQQQLPTWDEQGICIGQTFMVAANNGRDLSRRVHVLGFCRSIDLVSEAVEDTVLSHGGEVWQRDTQLAAGLGERLVMTVALPYLWGLPPAFDSLRDAILQGGGIVHKVSKQWQLL